MKPFRAIWSTIPPEEPAPPVSVLVLYFDGPHAIIASQDRRLHWVYAVALRIESLPEDMPDIFDWPAT